MTSTPVNGQELGGMDPIGAQQMSNARTWGDGKDGTNPFLSYFGPTRGDIQTNPYDRFGYTNFDLPEAYKGRNLFLRDTIDGFIMEDNTWFTSAALPYVRTDEHHFSWNEWHFDTHLVGRVPEEGISRLIRSSKRSFKESTVRRGIAFQLEHGFMNTPEGRQQYVMNLQQIKQSVQETANHDVIAALLSCRRYDREWERKHGLHQKSFPDLNRREVAQWAVAQKHANGLDIMHEEYKQRLARYNVTPGMWIFPPKLCLYLTMVAPEKTGLAHSEQGSLDRIQGGPSGPSALTQFRGVNVFETRLFDVYEGDLPIDLLRRKQTIGEYNPMYCPFKDRTVADYSSGYTSEKRDIVIYDEDNDNWQRISFKEALKHVHRPDPSEGEDKLSTAHGNDIFFRADGTRCQYLGEIQEQFLTDDLISKVASSMLEVPDKKLEQVESLIHTFNYKGYESIPMFKRSESSTPGMKVESVAAIVEEKGLESSFVRDTAARLANASDTQRFLHGVSDYVSNTDTKTAKAFYKAMAKKVPRQVAELRTYLSDSPFWSNDAVVASRSAKQTWDATNETWDEEKHGSDASYRAGDPATNYSTASAVPYTPSAAWRDTPWAVASRGSVVATGASASSSRHRLSAFGQSDLNEVLGDDAFRKTARMIGAKAIPMKTSKDENNAVAVASVSQLLKDRYNNATGARFDPALLRRVQIFLTAPCTMASLQWLADTNCFVPFNVVLVRSKMEYEMCSAILLKGGMETGMTAVGHNDFQLGDDVASKMHYGHYTFKSKAFVQQPRNIVIAENIYAQGYCGGTGTEFLRDESGKKHPDGEGDGKKKSRFARAIDVWLGSIRQHSIPTPIDLSGSFHGTGNTMDGIEGTGFHCYDGDWRRHAQDLRDEQDDPAANAFLEFNDKVNSVCYQGHQFSFNRTSEELDVVTRNTGHWGPNVYPGCGAVRAGEAMALREMRYESVPR